MYAPRAKPEKSRKSRKDQKLTKLIQNNSESEGEESEHELSYYIKDRVKLMKEVLKIIKPKKIKMMAPVFMKEMPLEEINSMLLEELLGISNKRLRYIFEGKTLDEESSSEEEEEMDVISLDDISEGELIILDSDDERKNSKRNKKHHHHHHRRKIKVEPGTKKIKKEKPDKESVPSTSKKTKETGREKEPMGEENLMSVLELLELQARAKAIRSQLTLEAEKKQQEAEQQKLAQQKAMKQEAEEDDDEIIMEVPKNEEIVIPSESESDEIEFTEVTTDILVNDEKSQDNTMENTPATAINEDNMDNENTNLTSISQESLDQPENIELLGEDQEITDSTKEVAEMDARKNATENDNQAIKDSVDLKIDSNVKENEDGESSETQEIGDWGSQDAKIEKEIAKLEQIKLNKDAAESSVDFEPQPGTSLQNVTTNLSSDSENDTLAVIAEREKTKNGISKKKKKEKKSKKSKKHKRSRNKEQDTIEDIEKQSREIENLMKHVEDKSQEIEDSMEDKKLTLQDDELSDQGSEYSNERQVEESREPSEPEEGELGTSEDEDSDSSDSDPSEFKGTVSEYKRLVEEANKPAEDPSQPSTSGASTTELLDENVPDLEQQKAEEKAQKLKEKRLRHIKGAMESYKKDFCADSESGKSSEKDSEGEENSENKKDEEKIEKGVKIIDSVVIKPGGIKINAKSLKRRVEVDDNDEIVINVDQDDLDCIICD